jgi:hypothetical protein
VRRARPGAKSWGRVDCVKLDDDAAQPGDPGLKLMEWRSR